MKLTTGQVVLADGTVVTADATENADLFKAIKGGMNNIGVVTHFKLKKPAALLLVSLFMETEDLCKAMFEGNCA